MNILRYLILLIPIISIYSKTFGGGNPSNSPFQTKIDSIQLLLSNPKLSPQEKAKHYYDISFFYYHYPSQLPDYVLNRMNMPTASEISPVSSMPPHIEIPDKKKNSVFIRTICDYIAGMTDNFAETEYKRIESIIRSMEDGRVSP